MKNIEYFREDFQYEAVKALIEDRTLIGRLDKIIDQNAFSEKSLRLIVCVIKEYYKKRGSAIDYVSLQLLAEEKCKNEEDKAEILSSIAKLRAAQTIGQETIEEELIRFFKLKSLVKIANTILEGINDGTEDDKIIKKGMKGFEDIQKLGQDKSETCSITTETVLTTLIGGDNECIPTGIPELDKNLGGGLGRQEIGLFVAPTGYGKTTAGSIFAHNAAQAGYKVLQIFFEDKPADIIRKHLAASTNSDTNTFKNVEEDVAQNYVKNMFKSDTLAFAENLILCKMPDAETTVEDIENKIKELINTQNFHPDMIVIDYFSSLKHSASPMKDTNEAQTRCMKKIKEMLAYRYNIAVWVMQQTNRTAVSQDGDSSSMGNWQGAYAATQPASVWITLQRTKEQKEHYKADLIFNKTRHSQPKNDLLDIVFDNSRLQIDCSGAMSVNDGLSYDEDFTAHF